MLLAHGFQPHWGEGENVPVNTEYRVAIRLTRDTGRNSWIIRNYRCTADDGNDNAAYFADTFLDYCNTHFIGLWNGNVIIDQAVVSYSSTPSTPAYVASASLAGTFFGSENLPDQVAALIRLTVGVTDTRHPAKVFIPYVPVVDNSTDLLTWKGGLDYAADKFAQSFNGILGAGVTYAPVKWSRGVGASALITDGEASSEYWTQRRRIPRGSNAVAMYPMVP